MELMHIDLFGMMLNHQHWYSMENSTEGELLMLNIGSVTHTILYPVNPKTPICYVCSRPLDLFTLSVKDIHGLPRGFCPYHMWENGVKKEYGQELSAAKQENRKALTEEAYLKNRASFTIRQWNREDALWWENQKALLTPKYTSWLDRQKEYQRSSLVPSP
jgi:hypothetical protein